VICMNYLITGGTGLIGKALIASLSQEASHITVLTRNIESARNTLGQHIHYINTISLADIENADVIINLAGEAIADKRWSTKQKNKICQSRWAITQTLTDFIKQAKKPPRVFISGSAIGIYGRQVHHVTEEYTHYHQEFTHEVCQTWEAIALDAASDKTRVAVLRTGIVLSPTGGALGKMLLPFKLGIGGKMGDGQQAMSWIHLNDMVSAILFIQNNQAMTGPINLTVPKAVSNVQFSQALAAQVKRPCFFTTPAWLLTLLFGEMADILLFGQHVIPQKLIDAGFSFEYETVSQAFNHLVTS